MIFPKEYLDTVKYYEVREVEHVFGGFSTVVVLHFKAWWKLSKKFKMAWRCADIGGEISSYQNTNEIRQTLKCLADYFDKGA